MRSNFFDRAVMKTSVIDPEFRSRYLSDPARPNVFEGRVVVFEGPEDYHERIDDPALGIDVQTILVIRNCGPVGYPGAAEVVNMQPPAALINAGIRSLPTLGDGRQSGTSGSPSILNVSPEAAVGGGIALLVTGDRLRIDLNAKRVDVLLSRRGDGGSPGRLAAAEARQPDALAGNGAPLCRAARRGRMPGAAIAVPRASSPSSARPATTTDLSLLCQNDVGGVLRGNVLGAPIAEAGCVNIGEQVFAGAEQQRGDRKVHLVDKPGA